MSGLSIQTGIDFQYAHLHAWWSSSAQGDALVELAASAIVTATTDHIVAARKANYFIFRDIPRGKYSPLYMQDKEVIAEKKDIRATVK